MRHRSALTTGLRWIVAFVMAPIAMAQAPALGDDVESAEKATRLIEHSVILSVDSSTDASELVSVIVNGQLVTLRLEEFSVRAPGFQTYDIGDSQVPVAIDPGPVRTRFGTVDQWTNSRAVVVRFSNGGIEGVLWNGGTGQVFYLFPPFLNDARVDPSFVDVYETDASSTPDETKPLEVAADPSCLGGPYVAQIGLDSDHVFWQLYGEHAIPRLEFHLAYANHIFSRFGPVKLLAKVAYRRSSANDPFYESQPSSEVFTHMRSAWSSAISSGAVDFVALLSATDLDSFSLPEQIAGSFVCHSTSSLGWVDERLHDETNIQRVPAFFTSLLARSFGAVFCNVGSFNCTDCPGSVMYWNIRYGQVAGQDGWAQCTRDQMMPRLSAAVSSGCIEDTLKSQIQVSVGVPPVASPYLFQGAAPGFVSSLPVRLTTSQGLTCDLGRPSIGLTGVAEVAKGDWLLSVVRWPISRPEENAGFAVWDGSIGLGTVWVSTNRAVTLRWTWNSTFVPLVIDLPCRVTTGPGLQPPGPFDYDSVPSSSCTSCRFCLRPSLGATAYSLRGTHTPPGGVPRSFTAGLFNTTSCATLPSMSPGTYRLTAYASNARGETAASSGEVVFQVP